MEHTDAHIKHELSHINYVYSNKYLQIFIQLFHIEPHQQRDEWPVLFSEPRGIHSNEAVTH